MIKSAATSVSASLALGMGAQAVPADDAAVSTDFAALLGSTVATGQDGTADAAALLEQATGKQMRQASGNPAGKKLPLALQDAASALAEAAKPTDSSTEDAAEPSEAAAPAISVTAGIILPGLVVPMPVSVTPAEPAAAPATAKAGAPVKQSTTESLALAAAARAARLPQGAASDAAPVAKPEKKNAAATAAAAQVSANIGLPQSASETAAAAATPRADGGLVAPALPPVAEQVRTAIIPADKRAQTASSANAQPASTITAGIPAVADQVRLTIAPGEPNTQPAASTSAQLASAQAIAQAATQQAKQPAPAQTAKPADPAAGEIVPAQVAADVARPTGAPLRRDAAANGAPPTTDAPNTRGQAAAAEIPAAPAQIPAASLVQTVLPPQDGQSFSQVTAPVSAAPTTAPVTQSGHDFAALVDRLVEARETASPGTVHAAITHSEFGQVSLRFDQDASGLSVSMNSADPEFAQAVQASSAQSQMANDNGSNGPRHETSSQQQQQGAGSASSQQQSQTQSSGFGRDDRDAPAQSGNRNGRTGSQQTQREEAADTRGGIYA